MVIMKDGDRGDHREQQVPLLTRYQKSAKLRISRLRTADCTSQKTSKSRGGATIADTPYTIGDSIR